MAADESQKQNEVSAGARSVGRKVHSSHCVTEDSLSSQEFGAGTTISKIEGRVALRGDIAND